MNMLNKSNSMYTRFDKQNNSAASLEPTIAKTKKEKNLYSSKILQQLLIHFQSEPNLNLSDLLQYWYVKRYAEWNHVFGFIQQSCFHYDWQASSRAVRWQIRKRLQQLMRDRAAIGD